MNKKSCDKECTGIIKDIKIKGSDFPRILIVQYEVNGIQYEIKENQVMKPH